MSATAEVRALFERYAETGGKHGFRLIDERECLGWVVEVNEDSVLLAWAPSPFEIDPPDEWIAMARIDLSSLSYWDDARRAWLPFVPQ